MFSGSVARGSRQLLSQMNDHRRFPGDRRAEQDSAYDLVQHLKKNSVHRGYACGECCFLHYNRLLGRRQDMLSSFSVSRISTVVLMTVSEFRDMLSIPHSTRKRANSG